MRRIYRLLTLVALLSAPILTTQAATNPADPGATSTGTSDISVTIPKLVKISGISDLTEAGYDGSAGGVDMDDDVCIYANLGAGGNYTVTISGGSNGWGGGTAAGFFVGNNANAQEIAYAVAWNDVTGTAGGVAVTHGVDLTTQTGYSNAEDCGASTNANFRVTLTQANLLAVLNGTYTGTLTIVITPE